MKMTTATKRVFRAYLCGGFAMLSACGGVVTNPPSSTSAGSGGSGGGDSGSGGTWGCEPASCDAKACGVVPDGCGTTADCGTCGDVMTCGADNTCECTEAVDHPDVLALCNGKGDDHGNAKPHVFSWCSERGGCDVLKCGPSPLDDPSGTSQKHPDSCISSGYDVTLDGETLFHVWCCAKSCDDATECNDGNDCTIDYCQSGSCYNPDDTSNPPCSGGTCESGTCVPSGQ